MLVALVVPVWRAKARRAAILLGLAATALSVVGGTPLSARLLATLEAPYRGRVPAPGAVQAVVVLGGGFMTAPDEPAGFKVNGAFDRVTAGLAALDRGVSTNLVFGGGATPIDGRAHRDNEAAAPWVLRRVPPTSRVWLLDACRNTRDEAVRTADLARRQGWRKVGLVTSAWHLPRSVAAFEREGMEVVPMGCSFEGTHRLRGPNRWTIVPNPTDLHLADRWVHEVVGRVYYRLRGWG